MSSATSEHPASPKDTAAGRRRRPLRSSMVFDLVLDSRGLWQGSDCFHDLAEWGRNELSTSEGRRRRVRLHIAGELLREWPCDPTLPLADDAARLAWARRLQAQYHGDEATHWPQAAWSARGHGVTTWQQPDAEDGETIRAWRDVARRSGDAIASITPLWRAALLSALTWHPPLAKSSNATLLFVEGRLVTVIELVRGKPSCVTRRHLLKADPAGLQDFLLDLSRQRRSCCVVLGAGLVAHPGSLASNTDVVVLGELHQALPWRPAADTVDLTRTGPLRGADFMRPARPANPWPWLAVACGLAMLALVAWEATQLQRVTAEVQAKARTGQPTAPNHPRAAALAFPWPAVLQAVEGASVDGLRWTQLVIDSQGRATLQGRTPDDAGAREAAQRLRASGLWQDVSLAGSDDSPAGWKFELSARFIGAAGAARQP